MSTDVKTVSAVPLPGAPSLQIFLNGRLVPKEQAVLSVFDHGLLSVSYTHLIPPALDVGQRVDFNAGDSDLVHFCLPQNCRAPFPF